MNVVILVVLEHMQSTLSLMMRGNWSERVCLTIGYVFNFNFPQRQKWAMAPKTLQVSYISHGSSGNKYAPVIV